MSGGTGLEVVGALGSFVVLGALGCFVLLGILDMFALGSLFPFALIIRPVLKAVHSTSKETNVKKVKIINESATSLVMLNIFDYLF